MVPVDCKQECQGQLQRAFLILPSISTVLPPFYDAIFNHDDSDEKVQSLQAPSFDFSLESTSESLLLSPPSTTMFLSPRENLPRVSLTDGTYSTAEASPTSPINEGNLTICDENTAGNEVKETTVELVDKDNASLGAVSRRFHALLKEKGRLHIDEAAIQLGKPRRRIYDVIHVLCAAGWIETSRGWVTWKEDGVIRERKNELEAEMSRLELEDQLLNRCIAMMLSKLSDLRRRNSLHVKYSDVRYLFEQSHVIAIKSPPNATLEVPNPERPISPREKRYRLSLNSTKVSDPIRIFLVQHSPLLNQKRKRDDLFSVDGSNVSDFTDSLYQEPDILSPPRHWRQPQQRPDQIYVPSL